MQPQLLHFAEEVGQHIGHGGRVVAGPVVVEGRQLKVLGHDVQLILAQVGQQVLGQDQAVDGGVLKGDAVFPAPGGDKAHVKVRIVGGQGPVPHKVQKGPQGLLLAGGSLQHLIGDAGELNDLRVQDAPGGDKGVEPLPHLSMFQHHCADLDDDLPPPVQAGGLDVKTDDLVVKGLIGPAVDHHPVVHVVDIIGLHAEQYLDVLGRVLGVGEGVGHAVVGDGDSGVAPPLRPLDHVLVRADDRVGLKAHRRQGVHGGHVGVQMQLHPLLRGGVLALLLGGGGDGHGLQHHVAIKAVHVQPPLDLQVHPLLHPVHDGLALVPGEELVHPDGPGVVGQVKGHHPGPPLFQLLVVHGEHVALHHHHAHVQLQLVHGGGPLGHRPAKDGLAFTLSLGVDGGADGGALHGRPADGLGAGKGVPLLRFRLCLGLRLPLGLGDGCGPDRLLSLSWLLRLGGGLGAGDLHAVHGIGPADGLLRLPHQVGSGPRRAGDLDVGAALGAIEHHGGDLPGLHGIGQLRPPPQGGEHL